MNKELFAEILAWLDAGAPHLPKLGRYEDVGFNMQDYIDLRTTDYTGSNCGTACCIAGYAMAKKGLHQDTVALELGLDYDQAGALFRGHNYIDGLPRYTESISRRLITPAMAAATIRHMLETGNVIWEGAE